MKIEKKFEEGVSSSIFEVSSTESKSEKRINTS